MPGWRRRPRTAHRLLLLVLVLGAVLVVVNLHAGDRSSAGTDHGYFELLEAHEDWPPGYVLSQDLLHAPSQMTQDMAGPRVVVSMVEEEGFFERLLPVGGAPRSVITLDMTHPASPSLYCINTRSEPEYPICPHAATEDRYISDQLLREGTWETHIVALFTMALTYYPSSTVIDLGAHVGVYSLLGARMGARAVAVEPVWASAVRLHAGALAGGVAGKVTILLHAMADHRFQAKLRYRTGNLGGTMVVKTNPREAEDINRSRPHDLVTTVTLDHLKAFVNTSIVLVKIDVEGWECGAVMGGKSFLTSHFAPYIFMEWSVVANNRHKYHSPCRLHSLQGMVRWLTSRGYHAHITKSGVPLSPTKVDSWRAGDIYWRHSTAPRLHQQGQS